MEPLELNDKITHFLTTKGKRLTREAWLERYPQATETHRLNPSLPASGSLCSTFRSGEELVSFNRSLYFITVSQAC
jgi:hypothetical protein